MCIFCENTLYSRLESKENVLVKSPPDNRSVKMHHVRQYVAMMGHRESKDLTAR